MSYPLQSSFILLESITDFSTRTYSYRFALPTPTSILGLPIGQHISIGATLPVVDAKTGTTAQKEIVRSYTPISGDHQPGHFDLLIKSYPTGNISKYMASLVVGQTIKVKGPKGAMVYAPNLVRRFGMIAGGTGITPMLQIIRAVIRGRKTGDKTEIDLIFANVGREDILLKEDLDALAKEDKGFRVKYVLNNPPEKWDGGVGFVTPEMIKVCLFIQLVLLFAPNLRSPSFIIATSIDLQKRSTSYLEARTNVTSQEYLPAPASDVKILLCGPPPMISAMKKATETLGYSKARPVSKLEDQVFAF